jgi:hypothetical protein
MRKVIVSKLVKIDIPHSCRFEWVQEQKGEALFHQFGVAFEEFDTWGGNYSTAIVEWPDGQLENVPVERVKFVDPIGRGDDE